MKLLDRLRGIPLFADLAEPDLERICRATTDVSLAAGDVLFSEGDRGDAAYLILTGEIEIVKASGPRPVLLAVRGADDVIGEMSLVREAPRLAAARARTDATLVAIPKATMDELLDTSPTAARQIFEVLLQRWQATESALRQRERMAQLGTLTAGLAHELNNPAAAITRSTSDLLGQIRRYVDSRDRGTELHLEGGRRVLLEDLVQRAEKSGSAPRALDAMARADEEEELADRLEALGVGRPWDAATVLVDLLDPTDLEEAAGTFGADAAPVLELVVDTARLHGLLYEIDRGASRLSEIVGALKSYAHLDRAPVQAVDVRKGLDDTLLILRRKLEDVKVSRDYAPDLPVIEAYGAELNQVWTNLLDNAADALIDASVPEPRVEIRAFPDEGEVVVEIEDNGPGIPEDIVDRVFDPFFTTKPPGRGSGMGLDITRSIVMDQHAGSIAVDTRPGRTVFRVQLPTSPPD